MKIYLAPLEGITNYVYRKALFECFDGFDKYFIPFIRAKQNLNLSGREKKDLLPENNEGMYAVPQILTKKAEDFIRTVELLSEYGYQEVNLNLGCPRAAAPDFLTDLRNWNVFWMRSLRSAIFRSPSKHGWEWKMHRNFLN